MPDPRVRRKARERALQFLFGLDFSNYNWDDAIQFFWDTELTRPSVKAYAMTLIQGVSDRREDLDDEIDRAIDRWSPDRVGRIERNVLRIALYEMRYQDDVPAPVAINEAIELAKNFGSNEAPRFVNGVLDKLATKNK